MTNIQCERIRALKANIDRYCRLTIELSEPERQYVQRRITEEHTILSGLLTEVQDTAQPKANPDPVIAALAIATDRNGHSHQ